MEGESLFFAVAGLSLSLAGFAALIASLRGESRTWDPINLWRVKTIIRQAFAIVFLALTLIPVFSITDVIRVTTRFGAVGLCLASGSMPSSTAIRIRPFGHPGSVGRSP